MGVKFILFLFILFLIIGCNKQNKILKEIKVSSPAFSDNGDIPDKYTCKGEDINPELIIGNIPNNTKSLALIVDDSDTINTFIHWIVWNISVGSKIEENKLAKEAVQGLNDFNINKYSGPCPPSGTHRYNFKVYALDLTLNLDKNTRRKDLERAMNWHILAEGKLIGLYSKK